MSLNNEVTVKEIFQGWYLVTGEWSDERVWGLSLGNHPHFIFPFSKFTPMLDPLATLSDDQINILADGSPEWQLFQTHSAMIDEMDVILKTSPEVGYVLVRAAIYAGFCTENHGTRLANWLLNQVAKAF